MSTSTPVEEPSREDAWRATIEGATSIWLQLAMVGVSVNAAMADTWMRGAEAMGHVLARAGAGPALQSPALGDEADPWATLRQAWAAAVEPWRLWMPFLRFDIP